MTTDKKQVFVGVPKRVIYGETEKLEKANEDIRKMKEEALRKAKQKKE